MSKVSGQAKSNNGRSAFVGMYKLFDKGFTKTIQIYRVIRWTGDLARGSMNVVVVFVIEPRLPVKTPVPLNAELSGAPKLARFRILNISVRNCSVNRSEI